MNDIPRGEGRHETNKPRESEMTDEFPYFVFDRRRDIELEAGLSLAGYLTLDEPKSLAGSEPPAELQQSVMAILNKLMGMVRSGRMPDQAIVFGWRGGRKPANAVDIDNDALMAAWAEDRFMLGVRVSPPTADGRFPVDSEIMQRMGLIPNETGSA